MSTTVTMNKNQGVIAGVFGCGFVVLGILAPPASAEVRNIDGNSLYRHCSVTANQTSPENFAMEAWACLGYVTAIMDGLSGGNSINGKRACIPPNVNMNQVVDVAKSFITDHPETRHLLAAGLVADALAHAFPCRP
jgi:hypothetical protein